MATREELEELRRSGRQESNPFLGALSKLAEVPIRAARLPFQLVGEVLQTPQQRAERTAVNQRRALSEFVTGEAPPERSEGRRFANILSLGLIPGNPSSRVDPNALAGESARRFEQLTPLQQRLLQAKRPSDFADLVSDDSFFSEEEPATATGQINQDLEAGFISPEGAAFEAARLAPEVGAAQQLFSPENQIKLLDDFTPESVAAGAQANDLSRLKPKVAGTNPVEALLKVPGVSDTLFKSGVDASSLVSAFQSGDPGAIKFKEQPAAGLAGSESFLTKAFDRGATPESIAEVERTGDISRLDIPPEGALELANDREFLNGLVDRKVTFDSIQAFRQTGDISQLRTEAAKSGADVLLESPSFVNAVNPTPESLQAAIEASDVSLLEPDPRAAEAVSPEQFDREIKLMDRFLDSVDKEVEIAKSFRTLIGAFAQNANDIPDDIREPLDRFLRKRGKSLQSLSPNGFRDVALVFSFMRALDPDSVVRESEQDLAIRSQGIPASLKVRLEKALNAASGNVPKGQIFSPEARNDLFRTIRDIMSTSVSGFREASNEFRTIAEASGARPDVVTPNVIRDVLAFFDETVLDERVLTAESVDTLVEQFQEEKGRAPRTNKEFEAFAREQGFSMPDGG